jgi:hypothetical protein
MRLPVSPATPISVASLPNHTKMFELVHVVSSMDDFAMGGGGGCWLSPVRDHILLRLDSV